MLSASTLNYVGYIEGSELFEGKADVVVTDGFTGNVALKTMEGTAAFVRSLLKRAFTRTWMRKLQAVAAGPVYCCAVARQTDSRNYNGATLVGLNGIVIKSHGSADALRVPARDRYRDRRSRESGAAADRQSARTEAA